MKNIPFKLFIIAVLLIAPRVQAFDLSAKVVEYKLPNGMKWLFVRRTQAPVFSGIVMVNVGGADEVEGKTGLAHMFEHMAFKGSDRIGTKDFKKEKPLLDEIEKVGATLTEETRKKEPNKELVKELSEKLSKLQKEADKYQYKNEIWKVFVRSGATDLNAYTNKDLTAYHASLPITRLDLWAKVTSEMVMRPAFREFYTERAVIAEERRSGTENNPDGAMAEKLLSTAYASGPYHWSTIGFEKDILGLTIEDARKFHDTYYRPNNMVGVLVGDINIGAAKAVVNKYFGSYKAADIPRVNSTSGEGAGGVEARLPFKAETAIAFTFHKPTLPDPTEYAFDVMNGILCEGRASRLQKKMVYEKKMAESVYCTVGYPGSRLSNLFLIWVEPLKSHSLSEIKKTVLAEIERLVNEPVDEDELKRVRKQFTSGIMLALDKNLTMAEQLAQFETTFGDFRLLAGYPKKVAEVDAAKVKEIAGKYLVPSNMVIVERVKK